MTDITYLTPEGLRKLDEELLLLRTVRREEVAARLHEALEDGELLENAEYESAKNEQAFIEGRIQKLEMLLANAVIIEHHTEQATDKVQLGAKVVIQEDGNDPETYTLVGAAEADPLEGRISNELPLGQAMLGKRVGDHFQVSAPAGKISFKIIEVAN